MKKQNILIVAIIVLVVLNLGTLSFLWFGHGGKKHERRKLDHQKVERYLEKKLDLDDEQSEKFRQTRLGHFDETHELNMKMKALRKELMQELGKEQIEEATVDSLITSLSRQHVELEKLNFYHLRSLRNICNEEQKQKFDTVIHKVMGKMHAFRERRKRGFRKEHDHPRP